MINVSNAQALITVYLSSSKHLENIEPYYLFFLNHMIR